MNPDFNEYRRLAAEHGTPLYIVSKSRLAENYSKLKSFLPKVRLFYAVKANHYQPLLNEIYKLGAGFDVASAEEIQHAIDAGAKPNELIFANTIKKESSIKFAIEKGVDLFTFDNEAEIGKLSKIAKGAKVLLHFKETPGVVDSRLDLQPVADDARIGQ